MHNLPMKNNEFRLGGKKEGKFLFKRKSPFAVFLVSDLMEYIDDFLFQKRKIPEAWKLVGLHFLEMSLSKTHFGKYISD